MELSPADRAKINITAEEIALTINRLALVLPARRGLRSGPLAYPTKLLPHVVLRIFLTRQFQDSAD